MTDDTQTPDSPSTSTSKRRRRRRRWLMFGIPIVAIAGLMSARAFAHGRRHGCGEEDLSDEELKDRRQHMVDFAARYLEATPQQKARLQALADEIAPQLIALRKEGKALRDKARTAVRNDDRTQLDQLRREGMLLADRASQQWLHAYGQLANVLTAEQREQLADHFGDRGGRGFWH